MTLMEKYGLVYTSGMAVQMLSILQQQQAHAFPKGPQGKGMGRDRMGLAPWLVPGRNEKCGGASRVRLCFDSTLSWGMGSNSDCGA